MTASSAREEGNAPSRSAVWGPQRPSGNLPLELSSFVGRQREISEVKRLLGANRLLTPPDPEDVARRGWLWRWPMRFEDLLWRASRTGCGG